MIQKPIHPAISVIGICFLTSLMKDRATGDLVDIISFFAIIWLVLGAFEYLFGDDNKREGE